VLATHSEARHRRRIVKPSNPKEMESVANQKKRVEMRKQCSDWDCKEKEKQRKVLQRQHAASLGEAIAKC